MKKVFWILVGGALITACGGPKTDRTDAGTTTVTDSGTITLIDSGRPTATDAGRRDSGGSTTTCSAWDGITATSIAPVPASCMPRCANSTLAAINACPEGDDGTCLGNALSADTTPSVTMPAGTSSIPLDCGTCFDIQRFHCFSQVCPDSASPFLVCDRTTDPDRCEGEMTALQTCLNGFGEGSPQRTTLNECFNTQVIACFNTSGGFLPTGFPAIDFAQFSARMSRVQF